MVYSVYRRLLISDVFRICAKGEPHAPSQDIAKISRIDYPGLVRMKEAQAAHELWTTDAFYKRFCTKVGRVVAYDSENSSTLRMINENRHKYVTALKK